MIAILLGAAPRESDVAPNFGAVGGAGDLREIVGALLTYGLVIAVLMLVISATTWAIASNSGSWHTARRPWFAMDMAALGQELRPHLWGKLVRLTEES